MGLYVAMMRALSAKRHIAHDAFPARVGVVSFVMHECRDVRGRCRTCVCVFIGFVCIL